MDGGYSTLPIENNALADGVVIDFDYFFSSLMTTRMWVLNHEVGHYLGLYHIWGKAGDGTLICTSADDGIADTPNQRAPNNKSDIDQGNILPICFGNGQLSNYQNFMDYSGVYGMFTKGQVASMREQIKIYRSGFLHKNGCPQEENGPTVTNNPTEAQTGNVGEICFSNPNMYSRKVIIKNIKTGKSISTTVGLAYYPKSTTRCLYDLQPGVYECKIYTTFTNTLTENFQLKISSSQQTIKITKDGFN